MWRHVVNVGVQVRLQHRSANGRRGDVRDRGSALRRPISRGDQWDTIRAENGVVEMQVPCGCLVVSRDQGDNGQLEMTCGLSVQMSES